MFLPLVPTTDDAVKHAVVDESTAESAFSRAIYMLNSQKHKAEKSHATICLDALENLFDCMPSVKVTKWFRVAHLACDQMQPPKDYVAFILEKLEMHGHRQDVCAGVLDAISRLYNNDLCSMPEAKSLAEKVVDKNEAMRAAATSLMDQRIEGRHIMRPSIMNTRPPAFAPAIEDDDDDEDEPEQVSRRRARERIVDIMRDAGYDIHPRSVDVTEMARAGGQTRPMRFVLHVD